MTSGEALHEVHMTVNGAAMIARVPARRLLSDCIRHDLGLTGTHVGCEHGVCGACTILLDGAAARSCLLLAVSADGAEITTVEGLAARDGTLSPVQQAFAECHGLQCGFCTPGFLTTVTAGLQATPNPDDEQVRDMVGGNLCRCTGYQNIVAAVHRAAEIGAAVPGAAVHEAAVHEAAVHEAAEHGAAVIGAAVHGAAETRAAEIARSRAGGS